MTASKQTSTGCLALVMCLMASSILARKKTLTDLQRDTLKRGGDRHAIVVDPVNRMLYEFYAMRKTDTGWQAAQASIFDLKTNTLRPKGWTAGNESPGTFRRMERASHDA